MAVRVYIDSCAVNRLALINVDPTQELADSEFRLAVTPDLEHEYRQALDHVFVAPYVKSLLRKLLERCERRGFLGLGGPPCAGFGEGGFVSEAAAKAIAAVPVDARKTKSPPANRTDSHLIALAMTDLVITDDRSQIRRWGQGRPGLIPWLEIEADRNAGGRLVALLRARAKRLR